MNETLFEGAENKSWQEEWQDMPEFIQEKQSAYQKIIVRFSCEEDVEEFAKRIGQKIYPKTQSIWFPNIVNVPFMDKVYIDES